jgi:hypothetical protein
VERDNPVQTKVRGTREIAMMNLITGIIGLGMVIIFLGFMVIWVKAVPLIIIVVCVMLLAAIDLVQSVRAADNGAGR